MNGWPFQPVLLWSDALLLLLGGAGAAMLWLSARREATRRSWQSIAQNNIAMVAATVLLLFIGVGLLDSLHFRARLTPTTADGGQATRYAVEVESLLDVLLQPLRSKVEKTYSAPLATHSLAKEALENSMQREFPRLKFGGAHLGDDLQRQRADLVHRSIGGAAAAVALWIVLVLPWRRLQVKVGADETASRADAVGWHAVEWTLLAVFVLAGITTALAAGYHVLGTDKVGQDVLYLALKSIRTGLLIGTLTTLTMLPLAVLFGILAGYLGGWVDDLIQYVYTTLSSIPGVLLIAAAVLTMQVAIDLHPEYFASSAERADARLLALCLILGVTSWTGTARLVRGETLKLRELEFVQAARAFGVGPLAIMRRHILPNLMHIVLITLVMDFSGLVLAEAVLSYVGVGVDPNTISFGTMINTARMELAREPMVWWSLAAAFGFMFVLVLAANLFADAVRDAFDPRLAASAR